MSTTKAELAVKCENCGETKLVRAGSETDHNNDMSTIDWFRCPSCKRETCIEVSFDEEKMVYTIERSLEPLDESVGTIVEATMTRIY